MSVLCECDDVHCHEGPRLTAPEYEHRVVVEGRMSDEQARRVGLNESLFRQVNEQIESLNHGFGADLPTLTVICECADGDCAERIEMAISAYEQVRADPRRYIVVPGHVVQEFESIVEHTGGYDVVEKRPGEAAKLAEETDPRS